MSRFRSTTASALIFALAVPQIAPAQILTSRTPAPRSAPLAPEGLWQAQVVTEEDEDDQTRREKRRADRKEERKEERQSERQAEEPAERPAEEAAERPAEPAAEPAQRKAERELPEQAAEPAQRRAQRELPEQAAEPAQEQAQERARRRAGEAEGDLGGAIREAQGNDQPVRPAAGGDTAVADEADDEPTRRQRREARGAAEGETDLGEAIRDAQGGGDAEPAREPAVREPQAGGAVDVAEDPAEQQRRAARREARAQEAETTEADVQAGLSREQAAAEAEREASRQQRAGRNEAAEAAAAGADEASAEDVVRERISDDNVRRSDQEFDREDRQDARQDARAEERDDARDAAARQEERQEDRQDARQDDRQDERVDERDAARDQAAREEERREDRQDAREEDRQDERQEARQDERRDDRRDDRRDEWRDAWRDARNDRDNDDDGFSTFETIALLGLGALVVGSLLDNGDEVISTSNDRIIAQRADGTYYVIKDDDVLLRQPGSEIETRRYSDGSTMTIVYNDDGTQVRTVRDATGRVLQRTRVLSNGTEYVLFDDTRQVQVVDVATLPRVTPREIEVTDRAALEAALREEPQYEIGRTFSLGQVRQIRAVREMVPVIDLDNITFESGSAAIRAEEAEKLVELGQAMNDVLADNPGEMFLIEGHTDAVGSASANLTLSDRRAESLALALTEYFDIPPENLVVQGYGEQYLKVATLGASEENRRVAVRRITPLLTADAG